MKLKENAGIDISQVEFENIMLTLGMSSSELYSTLLVQVYNNLNKLKVKSETQRSFHRKMFISKNDKHYKIKMVFHRPWSLAIKPSLEEAEMIAGVKITGRGVTKKFIFTKKDIDKALSLSLESGIFGGLDE